MGEKRTTSSYIPPDFNPNSILKKSKPKNGQHDLRFMLPFSLRCSVCGDTMFQNTKINARKELVYEEFYLDIPVYRIYINCRNCYSEITIKTDPKNTDYIIEKGANKTFDPFKDIFVEKLNLMKAEIQGIKNEPIKDVNKSLESYKKHILELESYDHSAKKQRAPKLKDIRKLHSKKVNKLNLNDIDIKKLDEFVKSNKERPEIHLQKREKHISDIDKWIDTESEQEK